MTLVDNPPLPTTRAKIHVLEGVQLASDGTVYLHADGSAVGSLARPMCDIICILRQQPKVWVQLRCIAKDVPVPKDKAKDKITRPTLSAGFFCIVYGPLHAFDRIGDFLETYDIVLQYPQGCQHNVRYRNPHSLSGLDDDAPYTIDTQLTGTQVWQAEWEGTANYLDKLEFPTDLPLAPIPSALKTQLFEHQRQALHFMQERERGWNFTGARNDVWKKTLISGLSMYVNTINDNMRMEEPPIFRGGILADQMGLGKTLTVASLIASDLDSPKSHLASQFGPSGNACRCTLIIVPPPLLDTWETQLDRHCQRERLSWERHHGQRRFNLPRELAQYNIILTTYHTVAREWKNRHTAMSILFSVRWNRIVLDEAHLIRDRNTQMAAAICALDADRRWAVTGTPIQNHVTDFVALLQFLRAYPYDMPTEFEDDIVHLWKHDCEAAISRLKKLIICIGLRRTSTTIDLPERTDRLHTLHFDPREKQLYQKVEAQVLSVINQSRAQENTRGLFMHALQGLNALRLICNFGMLSEIKSFNLGMENGATWGPTEAQNAFESLLATGQSCCVKCATDVGISNDSPIDLLESEMAWVGQSPPKLSQCGRILCGSCGSKLQKDGPHQSWCQHVPPCPALVVSTSKTLTERSSPLSQGVLTYGGSPTKIKALINDITSFPDSKSVVFSAWRTTLDLAASALNVARIRYVRYDGKVPEKDRALALAKFSSDPDTKVILFTISCGAVGLDLTAANRAYLMEPQWNPTVEDQALARIHRMGQTRPITTIRYVMADSYEQRVIMVQKRKKEFADMLLSSRKAASTGRGSGRFERLRSLLS